MLSHRRGTLRLRVIAASVLQASKAHLERAAAREMTSMPPNIREGQHPKPTEARATIFAELLKEGQHAAL